MVDVGAKPTTSRTALARGLLRMQPSTLRALLAGDVKKGDALAVARVAGIQAAKRTFELIPLCHQVQLTSVRVELTPVGDDAIAIEAQASAADRTGVEMEALTAAALAALTLYDMLKAIDREMVLEHVALYEKRGGKSGDYRRNAPASDAARVIAPAGGARPKPGRGRSPPVVSASGSRAVSPAPSRRRRAR